MKLYWLIVDNDNIPIIASADKTEVKIIRQADNFIYDFDDGIFKDADWVQQSSEMIEIDSVNLPGEYYLEIEITDEFDDGIYLTKTYFRSDSIDVTRNGDGEFQVKDGVIIEDFNIAKQVWEYTNRALTTRLIGTDDIIASEQLLARSLKPQTYQTRQVQSLSDNYAIQNNTKELLFNLGSDWDLTGKKAHVIIKENINSLTPIVDRDVDQIVDHRWGICKIILTKEETSTVGNYYIQLDVISEDDEDIINTAIPPTFFTIKSRMN